MAQGAINTANPSDQDRICKSCGRVMAFITPEGDLVPSGTESHACDICRPFEELYSTMQTKDSAFLALESRRFQHLPRYEALEGSRAAHKSLDNFLMQTEAHSEPRTYVAQPTSPISSSNKEHDDLPPEYEKGNKRRLGSSSRECPVKRLRPTLKKGRSVSFDATVIFYDKECGRPDGAFSRSSNEYAPGRNAPTKGREFIDTSGLNTTATRFFGVRKHKNGWVETKEGREMDEQWLSDDNQSEVNAGEAAPTLLPDESVGVSRQDKEPATSEGEPQTQQGSVEASEGSQRPGVMHSIQLDAVHVQSGIETVSTLETGGIGRDRVRLRQDGEPSGQKGLSE